MSFLCHQLWLHHSVFMTVIHVSALAGQGVVLPASGQVTVLRSSDATATKAYRLPGCLAKCSWTAGQDTASWPASQHCAILYIVYKTPTRQYVRLLLIKLTNNTFSFMALPSSPFPIKVESCRGVTRALSSFPTFTNPGTKTGQQDAHKSTLTIFHRYLVVIGFIYNIILC